MDTTASKQIRVNANVSAGQRGTAAVLVKMVRGKARDSSCAGKNGARESAGQRGTADVLLKTGRGTAAGKRGTARDSRCAGKTGPREPHPVWGFKNIKEGGVGV